MARELPASGDDDRPVVATPVLGGELMGAESDDAPTVLYIPTAAPMRGDDVTFALRRLADGRHAMLVFTSLDRLVEGCGDAQPWVSIRAEAVREFQYVADADTVIWDPVLDPLIRQHGEHHEERP